MYLWRQPLFVAYLLAHGFGQLDVTSAATCGFGRRLLSTALFPYTRPILDLPFWQEPAYSLGYPSPKGQTKSNKGQTKVGTCTLASVGSEDELIRRALSTPRFVRISPKYPVEHRRSGWPRDRASELTGRLGDKAACMGHGRVALSAWAQSVRRAQSRYRQRSCAPIVSSPEAGPAFAGLVPSALALKAQVWHSTLGLHPTVMAASEKCFE